ncbi:MAG: arylsulfatase, partial [Sphingomonadales bacterium]|nr:arylsulfatase [Sphingomonadales bacterium]
RNGMVLTWPKRIGAGVAGGLRSQFGHVNDIAPTILEAVGMAAPEEVDGVKQTPLDGTSLIYSFGDPKAPERHTTQYFEIFGNRAIYHNGWMASAFHGRVPWIMGRQPVQKFEDDKWELYDLTKDFSQARNLAARYPAKLAELKSVFDKEAARNDVLPLSEIRYNSGLPSLSAGKTSASYKMGATGIPETALPRFAGKSWTVEASVTSGAGTQGVVAAVGGSAGGWSLFVRPDGTPAATYRLFNVQSFEFAGTAPLAPGAHKLTLDFTNDGGFGKGGTLRFLVDGQEAGTGRLVASPIASFSLDDTFGVGVDTGSMVGPYPAEPQAGFAFRGGRIDDVAIRTR